jgi:EmrB/QacA subfamily drug resistance transporter
METHTNASHRWMVLGIVMVGTFMAVLDSSIVNVALPRMMSTFGVKRDQIEWVTTGFMLASAVTMPLVGWLVQRIGSKILFLSALTVFTLGSAACALAWSYDTLIVARIVQAIGSGAMMPVGMAIVASLFGPHERGKAMGIWATGIMVGPAVGPTLGGYLTDWFSWRTIFSVNLPFGVMALVAGLIIMEGNKDQKSDSVAFDWFGYIFISIALIGSLLALSQGQDKGWDTAYIRICIASGIVGWVMFIAVERDSDHPLLDLSLFKYRNYWLSMVLSVFRSIGLFGAIFLLPIFLQSLAGYTTVQAGLLMMPSAVAMGIMMPIIGRITDRVQDIRWMVAIGSVIIGVSLFMYADLDPLSSIAMILGPSLFRSVGLALMMTPLMTAGINAIPPDKIPMGSSFLNVSFQVGGAFGITLLNNYVTNSIHRHTAYIAAVAGTQSMVFQHMTGHTSDILAKVSQGAASPVSTISQLMSMVLRHVHNVPAIEQGSSLLMSMQMIARRATVRGFEDGFVLGGVIVLLCLPLCLMLKPDTSKAKMGA